MKIYEYQTPVKSDDLDLSDGELQEALEEMLESDLDNDDYKEDIEDEVSNDLVRHYLNND